MAFRQLARSTACFDFSWPDGLVASPISETDAREIGEFLLRTGHPLRPECEAGTVAGATLYVTRLFEYHRHDRNYAFALESSTVVRRAATGTVVGVCLVGGGGAAGEEYGVYDIQVAPEIRGQGIATRMIQRVLTVLAERGVSQLHLWRDDDSPARGLYERLGFEPTGAVE